jgi:predicted outer membrane repeat protein
VQVGNLQPGGTYYVGFYPNADMSYGFGFKATKQGGTTGWSEGALTTTAITTKRSEITNIPNLDKFIRTDWFFKADGTGDGSDWEHAGGVNLLVKLLGSELAEGVNYNKNTNGWRLYGASLHLAAGTYELPKTIAFQLSVNNKTAIYGGYPTNLTGTSLEGRDASANETIITKNGGTRLFTGNGSNLHNWTWDGITFTLKEGTTISDRGGAFYFNASTKGTVKFIGCTFENLKTTHSAGGGAFDFNTATQTFNASFTNCDFINNTGKIGGAIAIEDGRKAKIIFTDCDFSGNTATTAGGAIANSIGTIVIDGCSFSSNKSSTHGGAICAYGDNLANVENYPDGLANVYVYNSLFDSNDVSTHQGGAIKIHGKCNLVVLNSTFRKNVAKDGIIR